MRVNQGVMGIGTEGAPAPLTRIVFSTRLWILFFMLLATLLLATRMMQVTLDTNLKKMVPTEHSYIVNLFKHKDELSLGNDIRIAVEAKQGDIFNAEYLETLKKVSDAAFFLPGVDKSKVASLWTPNVRWVEVTVDGFRGGEVIPARYDGSEESLEQLRQNILRSGQVGRLIADDFRSTIVHLPLIEFDPDQGEKLDYKAFSTALEEIRSQYRSDQVDIHIIGFAKKMGDLIEGATEVGIYFLFAVAITLLLLTLYAGCFKSALLACFCSAVAVVWQLGLLNLLGFGIDPYSMLVPFLVFAIAVSHAVQIINGTALDVSSGFSAPQAAATTFQRLYIPGLLALVSDAIGFATLYIINCDVIQELAVAASIGVLAIVLTNLLLLPILISYIGVGEGAVVRARKQLDHPSPIWTKLSALASPKWAPRAVAFGFALLAFGLVVGSELKVGDLDEGAPELHQDSRYNLDVKYITQHYSVSADVLVVMVETPAQACTSYTIMDTIDRFHWIMRNEPGVESVVSLVTVSKVASTGMNEGSLKWAALPRDPISLNYSVSRIPNGLMNMDCSLVPIFVFLEDHRAETLENITDAVKAFAADNNSVAGRFVLASGNAGVEAAVNETISAAQSRMLILVYAVVSLLCFATFRDWRAVVAIITPLALTSVLCQALMAILGIGVKVATLPVIALGVGIGVDYGIYIYSRLNSYLAKGYDLQRAYLETLKTTGKAVIFTGVTLAIGVGTWIFSDIKYQADMGILLTFMFLWNMVGAIGLLPAIALYLQKSPKSLTLNERVQANLSTYIERTYNLLLFF